MAVRDDVVLVSDGGDVTVGRQTASFVYGEFNVVLPHGREKVETEERLQDGYVYRPKGGIKGPFDVGFVRADATVDLEADTSDLEVVVDAAQKQTEGDVFFERDISQAGLGRFVLDRDFRVGDVVTVELWGKRLRLPVTAGDYVASVSEGPAAARVHVGGQLISDSEVVARQNGELRRQIAREKAERQRQVASESSARRVAVAGERIAREAAVSGERSAREQADRALQSQIDKRPTSEALNSEIRGLNGRITGLNSDLTLLKQTEINSLQGQINARQGEINTLNDEFQKQQREINNVQSGVNTTSKQAIRALTESLQLQYLNNYGSFKVTPQKLIGALELVRADHLVGCSLKRLPDRKGSAIVVHESGTWQFALTLNFPGISSGTYEADLDLSLHINNEVNVTDAFRIQGRAQATIGRYGMPLTLISNVDMAKGDSVTVNTWATQSFLQETPELDNEKALWTVISARQLSRVGQPEIPAELL